VLGDTDDPGAESTPPAVKLAGAIVSEELGQGLLGDIGGVFGRGPQFPGERKD
jgi:hypothetical protein